MGSEVTTLRLTAMTLSQLSSDMWSRNSSLVMPAQDTTTDGGREKQACGGGGGGGWLHAEKPCRAEGRGGNVIGLQRSEGVWLSPALAPAGA